MYERVCDLLKNIIPQSGITIIVVYRNYDYHYDLLKKYLQFTINVLIKVAIFVAISFAFFGVYCVSGQTVFSSGIECDQNYTKMTMANRLSIGKCDILNFTPVKCSTCRRLSPDSN